MLDGFEILTTSGVVLWSKHYVPVGVNVINSLIKDVLIEENVPSGSTSAGDGSASRNPLYKKDKYTLKWTMAKDLGLIFVVSHNRLPASPCSRLKRSRPSTSHYYNSRGLTNSSTTSRRYSPRSIAISSRNQAQLWWSVRLTNTSTGRLPTSKRAVPAPSPPPPHRPAPRPSLSLHRHRATPKTNALKRQHHHYPDCEGVRRSRSLVRIRADGVQPPPASRKPTPPPPKPLQSPRPTPLVPRPLLLPTQPRPLAY